MAARSFFDLPRELRDAIYEHYVTVDGGYVYNPDTDKLKPASATPHRFGLQYTCRRAASEMAGLALQYNTVTFATVANARERAFRWDFMFNVLSDYHARRTIGCFSPIPSVVREAVAREFPDFQPAIDHIAKSNMDDTFYFDSATFSQPIDWVEPSVHRALRRFLTRWYVEAGEAVSETYEQEVSRRLIPLNRADDYIGGFPEWHMPSDEELDSLAVLLRPAVAAFEKQVGKEVGSSVIEFDGVWEKNRFLYRFSAAAVAVRFLQLNPGGRFRADVRRLLLNEDRESVVFPECHGKGLVPFCCENPRLRIERRVNLWRNLFLETTRGNRSGKWRGRLHGGTSLFLSEESYAGRRLLEEGVTLKNGDRSVSTDVAKWVREASVLPSSISLVLDGDPAPEQASKIFHRTVVLEATWQRAMEESLPQHAVYSPEWWAWRDETGQADNSWQWAGWICTGWPQMVVDMINGAGPVSCNFDLVAFSQWDVEQIISDNPGWSGWSSGEWLELWNTRPPMHERIPTEPPLPNFQILSDEDMLPPEGASAS